jgi:outer membrane biosynthesis protein TonB
MDVRILRSVHPVLDREADRVVRQWRYSPVVLNDIPVPFILTVTLSFALEAPR